MAWSKAAMAARYCPVSCPPVKIGPVAPAARAQIAEDPLVRAESSGLTRPNSDVRPILGKKSALAIPMRAEAAIRTCSAPRRSGLEPSSMAKVFCLFVATRRGRASFLRIRRPSHRDCNPRTVCKRLKNGALDPSSASCGLGKSGKIGRSCAGVWIGVA